MVSDTSARPSAGRPAVPAKTTSSILPPRSCLAPCCPITQVKASTTFDLPDPLGPTTQVMPGSNRKVVAEANDLNPRRVRVFKYTPVSPHQFARARFHRTLPCTRQLIAPSADHDDNLPRSVLFCTDACTQCPRNGRAKAPEELGQSPIFIGMATAGPSQKLGLSLSRHASTHDSPAPNAEPTVHTTNWLLRQSRVASTSGLAPLNNCQLTQGQLTG